MGKERKRWKAAEGRGMKQSVLIHIVFGGVYILVSVVNFLFGVVPFPPVEPDLTAVFWRVLFAGLWLALGLWGSALLKSKWPLGIAAAAGAHHDPAWSGGGVSVFHAAE